jgi:hypothetical protein
MFPLASFTENVGEGVTGNPAVASAAVAEAGATEAGLGGDVDSLHAASIPRNPALALLRTNDERFTICGLKINV